MFDRSNFLILALSFFLIYFATFRPKTKELEVIPPKESYLQSPLLSIKTTENCAEIFNKDFSENEKLFLLLLPNIQEMNHERMIHVILTKEENSHSLISSSENSSFICELTPNQTYYLYYFIESSINQKRSLIEFQKIQTKPKETFWTQLVPYSHTLLTILCSVPGIFIILLYWQCAKYKLKGENVAFESESPSKKIIKDWKLVKIARQFFF